MTNLRKFIVVLAVVVAILVVYAVMEVSKPDYRFYPKVFYEYKKNGKTDQTTLEDINKGFK